MLQTIGEWYKLIDLELTNELLEKRRIAASTLATDWVKLSQESAFDVVAFSVDLFSSDRKSQNNIRDDVLNAVRDAHPMFDAQSTTAEADLRVCCAVALNELFARQVERKSILKSCILPAACTAAALRWRSTRAGIHVSKCMSSLLKSAEAILEAADERRRVRKDLPSEKFKSALSEEGANLSTVGDAIDLLYSEMLKDREEIQALWWVFGGYSHLQKSALQDLNASNAAVIAGCELAQIIKAPATFALTSLCARATRLAPDAAELTSFETLLQRVDKDLWKLLDVTTRGESFIRRNPSIFPVSFTGLRLLEDEITTADIIRNLPDWATMDRTSAQVVAMQLFAERSLLAQIEDR